MTATHARRVRFKLWPDELVVARLRRVPDRFPETSSPLSLVVLPDEVSVLASRDVVAALGEDVTESAPGWRALSLEADLGFEVVGVIAAISAALAQVGIPALVFSSFGTDHLAVPAPRLGTALAALGQVALEDLLPPS